MNTAPNIPFPVMPSADSDWNVDLEAGRIAVIARPRSDIYVDPRLATPAGEPVASPVTLLGTPPAGDFQLRARVMVDFAATFDAGVLLLWCDDGAWAKLCFEWSPDGEPMVVSVVNHGVADDANSFVVHGGAIWLRVSRVGSAYAFHASTDGRRWRFVRLFALGSDRPTQVGFEAQSPTGDGCAVTFDHIAFTRTSPRDLRDGS